MLLIVLPKFHGKTNSRLQLCRHKMVKGCNCLVRIVNGPESSEMTYVADWYSHGRLADGFSWRETIKPGEKRDFLSYELDRSVAGCSGYVTYRMFDTNITIAFSNPFAGYNKLGVGTGGKKVWDEMCSHDYDEFTVTVDASDKKTRLKFDCKCTGGSTNRCTVNITACTN